MFDVARGSLEGADDPGNVLRKRQNLMTILSALSLMSLKGCEAEDPLPTRPSASPSLVLFKFLLGLLCICFWSWMRHKQHAELMHEEPDAEPLVSDDVTMFGAQAQTNVEAASSSTTLHLPVQQLQHPALTAENYVAWLIERPSVRPPVPKAQIAVPPSTFPPSSQEADELLRTLAEEPPFLSASVKAINEACLALSGWTDAILELLAEVERGPSSEDPLDEASVADVCFMKRCEKSEGGALLSGRIGFTP
eukprot:s2162_g4.t1